MTMPAERTRSVIQAADFLTELSANTSLPESIRSEARRILRHYPSSTEMLLAAQVEERLCEGTPFRPFFSSSIDLRVQCRPKAMRACQGSIGVNEVPPQLSENDLREAADRIFGNMEKSERWMTRPLRQLNGQSPAKAFAENPQLVYDILVRIQHGIYM